MSTLIISYTEKTNTTNEGIMFEVEGLNTIAVYDREGLGGVGFSTAPYRTSNHVEIDHKEFIELFKNFLLSQQETT